jgi:hypothetical protein
MLRVRDNENGKEHVMKTLNIRNSGSSFIAPLLLWAFTAIVAAIAPAFAQQDTRAPYSLSPDSVAAGESFDLHLLSYRFTCGTTYSHQSVSLEGDKVVLSFLATDHPEAICPAVYMPYGPTFKMAAMTKGYYNVYARRLAPCMVSSDSTDPVCMMEPVPEFAGMLTVGITEPRGWFLRPKEVPAEEAFTMHLLNYAYGNCNTSFTREVLEKRDGAFYVSFVIENHPEHVCVTDIRPYGPSFDVRGQPVGKYPVFANPQNPCRYATPQPCLASSSPDRWILVDTLVVRKGGSTGVLPGNTRLIPSITFPAGTVEGYRPDGRKAEPLPLRP